MTREECEIAINLYRDVTFLPATWDKSFTRDMAAIATRTPTKEITEKQSEWLYRLLYKYRRQVPQVYKKYADHPNCKKKETV